METPRQASLKPPEAQARAQASLRAQKAQAGSGSTISQKQGGSRQEAVALSVDGRSIWARMFADYYANLIAQLGGEAWSS